MLPSFVLEASFWNFKLEVTQPKTLLQNQQLDIAIPTIPGC